MNTETTHPQDGRALLADFIKSNTTQAKFAREIGCSESHLSLVLKGLRGVSFGLAKKMSEASGGKVPVEAIPHKPADEVAA